MSDAASFKSPAEGLVGGRLVPRVVWGVGQAEDVLRVDAAPAPLAEAEANDDTVNGQLGTAQGSEGDTRMLVRRVCDSVSFTEHVCRVIWRAWYYMSVLPLLTSCCLASQFTAFYDACSN